MMTTAERNALRKAHDKMGELARAKHRDAYSDANIAFHDRLYVGSHNVTLAGFARDLRRRLQPFRRSQFESNERLAQSFAEHEKIVVAIERGKGDEAAALMRHHTRLAEPSDKDAGAPRS